ncbi:MAG: DUF2867 domain-containing protein [Bdellovibrio sp.]|nr:DUF2867 domain-containing protein [Bdellovibrio sp.]
MRIKIIPRNNKHNEWIIHDLVHDFVLRDIWCLPIKTERPFREFLQFFFSVDPMNSALIVKTLFKFRLSLGRIFALDSEATCIPITGEASIGERLIHQFPFELPLPRNAFAHFHPVYQRENEALLETSNKTIFALIHLGKKDHEIWLSVYTKSFGLLSDCYMGMIKPFRHYIIYPLWLNYIKKEWEKNEQTL